MRIVTVGGGPAGLYASLLLKKADPSREVTVIERNPAGATYGWGVVFSDRTLGEFREADARTYTQITDGFVLWDAIDVRFKDEVIRSGGHVFAGLARRRLLAILQGRCGELGVELRFETEAPDRFPDADLVIGADGVRSLVRDANAEAFRPRLAEGRSRYVWYGAELALDSFTFIFRENEHGFFQVHAYPFDGTMSTFIVECSEDTWRRAGLDEASETESIAYCEKLFAPDLQGAALRSNASKWIRFVTVKNRSWHQGNTVLLGDAAHTAHFSIGSGTKLAMEDAIALARGFENHPDDLAAALADYESERKPVVERFQEAAAESRAYFEETERWKDLAAPQFAFHLLTRSGRIDYDVLRTRDALYADGVDRWFSGIEEGVAPPPLFTPFTSNSLETPTRAVASGGRTVPGAALALTDIVAVGDEGRITPEDVTSGDADRLRELADATHAAGALAGLRVGHAGRRGATRPRREGLDRPLRDGAWPLLAASPEPYSKVAATPKEMDPDDIARVTEAFAASARAAADAGFDLLEVHMAHGYLLGGFLSPLTNHREDAYGGSLEARIRFPLELLRAVRAAWEGPLAVALNATDWTPGGTDVSEAVETARMMRDAGCDLVEVLAGHTVPRFSPQYSPAFLAPFADRIRNEAGIPVVCGGGVTTTGRANTLLAGGRADLVILDPPR